MTFDLDAEWDVIFAAGARHIGERLSPRCEECNQPLAEGEILLCRRCEAQEERQAVLQAAGSLTPCWPICGRCGGRTSLLLGATWCRQCNDYAGMPVIKEGE